MKHCILPAVLLCMTLLAGCTGRKVDLSNVTESTIGVNGDGSVEEVVIESFDKEYYSLSDLTAYVNKQVDSIRPILRNSRRIRNRMMKKLQLFPFIMLRRTRMQKLRQWHLDI